MASFPPSSSFSSSSTLGVAGCAWLGYAELNTYFNQQMQNPDV